MDHYSFVIHTPAYIGPNCMKDNAAVFKSYGKKAYVLTSDFGKYSNYALEDVEAVLKAENLEYRVDDTVEINPPVESVARITERCRKFGPDFLIAIGGGATLDTAKAVSVLLPHPGVNPYDLFWGKGTSAAGRHTTLQNESSLPILMAPTTAGTGSEVTASSVLTRADLDTKIIIYQNVFCELAFLDPRYIMDSPRELLHTGAMDALCHTVESYLNVKSNDMTRAMGEVGMKKFAKFKDPMLNNELTERDYQNMLIASYFDGIAFQCGTSLPHGMGYPLSHHKGVLHGLACGIFLAEYLRSFKNQELVKPVVELCGFQSVNEFSAYIQKFMQMDVRFEVTKEEVEEYIDLFCTQEAHRLKRHPEPIGRAEVSEIYYKSLAPYIKK